MSELGVVRSALVFVGLSLLACDSDTPVARATNPDAGDSSAGASDAGHMSTPSESSVIEDAGSHCSQVLSACTSSDDVNGLGNFCLRVSSAGNASECAAVVEECLAYCGGESNTTSAASDLSVEQCKAMGDTCHDFDTGSGLGNLCHEVGHTGNLTWCGAIYGDCVALCGEPGSHEDDAGERVMLDLQFAAKVGAEDFECANEYHDVGLTGSTITPLDLRFYVSNIRLLTHDGDQVPVRVDEIAPYQGSGVALLDFTDGAGNCRDNDATTNTIVHVSAPAGEYTGVAFSTSVPEDLNHQDPLSLAAPLQASDMTWGWLAGYKFIKLELQTLGGTAVVDAGAESTTLDVSAVDAGRSTDAGTLLDASAAGDASSTTGTSSAFDASLGTQTETTTAAPVMTLLHVGSIACSESTTDVEPDASAFGHIECANSNRNDIVLEGFSADDNVIVFDVAEVVAQADLSRSVFCHPAGPSCAAVFEAVGVDYESGGALETVRAFRVE